MNKKDIISGMIENRIASMREEISCWNNSGVSPNNSKYETHIKNSIGFRLTSHSWYGVEFTTSSEMVYVRIDNGYYPIFHCYNDWNTAWGTFSDMMNALSDLPIAGGV